MRRISASLTPWPPSHLQHCNLGRSSSSCCRHLSPKDSSDNAHPLHSGCGGLGNRTISVSTGLHSVAVNTRGVASGETTLSRLLASVVIHVFEIEGVDMARNVTKSYCVSELRRYVVVPRETGRNLP